MHSDANHKPPLTSRLKELSPEVRKLIAVVLVAGIFGLGWAGGSGRLHFNHDNLLTTQNSGSNIDYSSVNQVYNLIKQDYDGQLQSAKVLDGLKQGLAKATGDPYTEYFNPADSKAFSEQLSGSFQGIGAELGSDKNGNVVIISPLSGYPADKAGLKPKDLIFKVNGKSTSDMSVDSVVKLIRGPKNTSVKLSISRDSQPPFDVTITRAEIDIPSVTYKEDGNIGYLKISQFGPDTVNLATKAAKEFKDKGVKGVVLDLRGNPGGYLDGAVGVSSLWLKSNQKVVEERRAGQSIRTDYASGRPVLDGLPTVVLIDAGSASASEITAGALHDNGAATLVGEKSFGKGSVQQIEQLSGGGSIKITIARWFTPKGRNIDKEGIEPDVKIVISDADAKAGTDTQKDKAYQLVTSKF